MNDAEKELIQYLSDKKNVINVLRRFLSKDPSVCFPFYEFAALSQSCLAVYNLRATEPDRLSDQIKEYKVPKNEKEFSERMRDFYALYSILQTADPLEEDMVVYQDAPKDGKIENSATKYRTTPQKGLDYPYTIAKGVHVLDVGKLLPEFEGMFIIPPFCKFDWESHKIVEDAKRQYAPHVDFETISSEISEFANNSNMKYGDYEDTYLRKRLP